MTPKIRGFFSAVAPNIQQVLVGSLVVMLAFIGWQNVQIRNLTLELRNALVANQILEKAQHGGGTVTTVVPGTGERIPVVVSPQGPNGQVVVTAPSAPRCKTDEECKRVYGAAPQHIHTVADIPPGTIVAVCLDAAGHKGACPEGKEANLPLSKSLHFTIDHVLTERGVFTTVQAPGSAAEVTQIVTTTEAAPPVPGQIPSYHIGVGATVMGVGFNFMAVAGPEYQGLAMGGIYRVTAGYGCDVHGCGYGGAINWTLPLF